jgi:hypothetical protein
LGWTETGTYQRTLTAVSGADSIVTTVLNVIPVYNITEDITIKEGENYMGWTETGQYERILTSVTGCDSTVTTNLVVGKNVSPESEYLFEETAGTTVTDSKGNNNGTFVNGETRSEGVIGKGIELNGSNHINLGQCFAENVQNQLTLSAWIKPYATAGDYQGIIMHGAPETDSYALYIHPGYKSVAFKTSGTSSSWLEVKNADNLWDGDWHNITVTYNGAEKVIYLDNVVVAQANVSGNITSGAGYNLLLGAGRDTNPASLFFSGAMDEVRIYNYALNESEVSQLYSKVVQNRTIEPVYSTEDVSICQGENYLGWTETGTYQRTLTAVSGADSIVTTVLNVNPVYNITEDITIKEGENYMGWTETGQYERILTSVTGCDSTVTTNLVVEKVNGKGKNNSSSADKISPSTGNSESTSTTDPGNQAVGNGKSSVVVSAIEFNAFESYEEFIIYPNPAKSYINIDYSVLPEMNTKVEILNGNGQVVYNQTVESSLNRIDINHLSPGMYYIRSISNNRANIKKLIVE